MFCFVCVGDPYLRTYDSFDVDKIRADQKVDQRLSVVRIRSSEICGYDGAALVFSVISGIYRHINQAYDKKDYKFHFIISKI